MKDKKFEIKTHVSFGGQRWTIWIDGKETVNLPSLELAKEWVNKIKSF
jgi:hypothetical protein